MVTELYPVLFFFWGGGVGFRLRDPEIGDSGALSAGMKARSLNWIRYILRDASSKRRLGVQGFRGLGFRVANLRLQPCLLYV